MALRFSRLDRKAVRQLKPGEKITEHGITAERLKDGDTRYSVNIMVDGERIHRVVGRESDGVTRTQAENFIAAARSNAGEDRLNLPKGRKLRLSFTAAADLYLKKQREIGAKNIVAKEQHLETHLKPYFGAMHLQRISSFTLQKFEKRCLDADLSVATKNRIAMTYNHMTRRLFEWKETKKPMPLMAIDPEDNERDYVLTDDEETALLDAALADSNVYIWLFVKMGLDTSMRHREILSCRFENLDPVRRRLRVQVKGGRWRQQPLPRSLVKILVREHDMAQDQDGWIFPSKTTKTGHVEAMSEPFARIVQAAGMDPKTIIPHTLRHTAITRFAGSKPDLKTLQAFSGHKSIPALMRYMHRQEKRVDEAMDRMERARTPREHPDVTKLRRS